MQPHPLPLRVFVWGGSRQEWEEGGLGLLRERRVNLLEHTRCQDRSRRERRTVMLLREPARRVLAQRGGCIG